jgi:hypothetical protein
MQLYQHEWKLGKREIHTISSFPNFHKCWYKKIAKCKRAFSMTQFWRRSKIMLTSALLVFKTLCNSGGINHIDSNFGYHRKILATKYTLATIGKYCDVPVYSGKMSWYSVIFRHIPPYSAIFRDIPIREPVGKLVNW